MSGMRVRIEGLAKSYFKAGHEIAVLRGVDFSLEPGEKVAIIGPSGSGKSTFLQILGLLDRPSVGLVELDGLDIAKMPARARDALRNERVGFVFQAHHLLPEHTALANVEVPLRLAGASAQVTHDRAKILLETVGLGERLTHQPGELSGGEQQRVALARALVMGPGLVLADEPTGNLDPTTAKGVFEVMLQLNEQLGSTLIVVTHSHELAERFSRRFLLRQGCFEEI